VDHRTVEYLKRIGAERPTAPTPEALRDLHARHQLAVPFENLSIHLGEPIVLDEDSLFDKIVLRRRGGFCYELNGAFGRLLTALGFAVSYLAAGVFGEGGAVSPLFDHMVLGVEAGGPWLADVGFGDHSLYPLRLDDAGPQPDPQGTFQVSRTPDGDLDILRDGKPQYRAETRPRRLVDFEPACWWQQTSVDSHFRRNLVCTMPADGSPGRDPGHNSARRLGRVTLSGRRLIRTLAGERQETDLGSDGEVLAAYRDLFGIRLDRVPQLAGLAGEPSTVPTGDRELQPTAASTKPNRQAK
jgi:N-hydroxyarylamine O-acetyltransferase